MQQLPAAYRSLSVRHWSILCEETFNFKETLQTRRPSSSDKEHTDVAQLEILWLAMLTLSHDLAESPAACGIARNISDVRLITELFHCAGGIFQQQLPALSLVKQGQIHCPFHLGF